MIKLLDIICEINIRKPSVPLYFKYKDKIDKYIVETLVKMVYLNNIYIIDSYMSIYSLEDIITDYVKHYMLNDEGIDIDSEEINQLDKDEIIEYIDNNKSLQSYLCNIFWKYYIDYIGKNVLPILKEESYNAIEDALIEDLHLNDHDLKFAIGVELSNLEDEYYLSDPTDIMYENGDFYQYLYNELTK
jgi:hypothetical protein